MQPADVVSPTVHPGDVGFSFAASSAARKQSLGTNAQSFAYVRFFFFVLLFLSLLSMIVEADERSTAFTPCEVWHARLCHFLLPTLSICPGLVLAPGICPLHTTGSWVDSFLLEAVTSMQI